VIRLEEDMGKELAEEFFDGLMGTDLEYIHFVNKFQLKKTLF
jgi:hypothetical protein